MAWLTEDIQYTDEGQALFALPERSVDQPHDPQEQRLRVWIRMYIPNEKQRPPNAEKKKRSRVAVGQGHEGALGPVTSPYADQILRRQDVKALRL